MALLIRDGTVLTPGGLRSATDVRVEGARIAAVAPGLAVGGAEVIEARGCLVAPGFIDVHIHGAGGSMCEDGDPRSVRRISATLAGFGVTGFLATVATMPLERVALAVATAASVAGDEPGARVLGVHLEGPYLSPLRAGAQPIAWMRPPSIGEFDDLQAHAKGMIRLVTVAPELPGAIEFIGALRDRGVTVALGHSNATETEMLRGIEAGATHATHLFNAMRELHHREPGVVGVALTDDRVSAELICDGHHLAPRAADLALRCKPRGKAVLVSDAVGALGMPDGEYEMFGVPCLIAGGAVRLRDGGQLAGSCLSLDRAVRNLHAWLPGRPVEELLEAASTAAAAVIGETRTGAIVVGRDADLVVLDSDLRAAATVCRGRVYRQEPT